ncbi:hypothetical protein EON83_01700 [bacterium]|nr:MAG: hypothetical protein EON83_01700 [bacterium]
MPSSQSLTSLNSLATTQQLNRELSLLQAKQQQLKTRLTTLSTQQLQESYGQFRASRSSLFLPSSLDMIIFGLREELERVNELLGSLQHEIAPQVAA